MNKKEKESWVIHLFFGITSLLMILPLLLVLIASLTDEQSILANGYSFFPEKFSLDAYHYLFILDPGVIFRSYGVTIIVTVVGTIVSLLLTAMLAYPLSRTTLPFRNAFAFFVFFTLLFNGGLVSWYLVYARFIDLRDTVWALIIPGLLLNGFNVLIMRTFFTTTIPPTMIEAAHIDGAGEARIFAQFVVPLSKPVFATIGLFNTIAYWNDWYNSLVFLSRAKFFSLQYMLNMSLLNIQFLSQNSQNTNAASLMQSTPQETMRMAMAIIGIGPILLAYPFFQKYFVKGLTIGAIKG
ncbi:carbohydrate ABC transporter permease [Paenibacillus sabinae]|uniref:Binding-protein-dependent transport system inner membrane protein n=1 Tax=Paenibacillus sabinae T27 TaxID=1268072 RepID=X4ZFQ1_9BACL|nr:carbohydrate ABC transporter permease [Paenibacillus sabinae]AHV98331.1 binding-protein-dependent transport system inner membrane protein [Paenibacillus sabinae T27]